MSPKHKLVFDSAQWKIQHNETPFSFFKLNNVFSDEAAVTELRNAVSRLTFSQKTTDMFNFSATKDLWISKKSLKTAIFRDLFKFLEFFRGFLSTKFEVELDSKISVSSSLYENKDYLLCHDDKSDDRLIAFIFYLNSTWKPEWGGSLDIFDHDENGQPSNIVNQIYPDFNSMIFFKVGNYTYHQVAEVTTNMTPRITINGWFHSKEAYNLKPLPFSDPPVEYTNTRDHGATLYLNHFASNEFTQLKYMEIIVENLKETGVMMLQNFLKPHIYTKIAKELESSTISWHIKGPANRRKYKFAEQYSLPPTCKALVSFFQSQYMCSYLEELSSKKLFHKKRGEQEYRGLCFAEMQFWEDGCYSLLADDDNNYDISTIDVFLFFNVNEDEEESMDVDSIIQSGNIYYYEKFETFNYGTPEDTSSRATEMCHYQLIANITENYLRIVDLLHPLVHSSAVRKIRHSEFYSSCLKYIDAVDTVIVNMFSFYFSFTLFLYLRAISGANENIYRFCVDEYEIGGSACQAIQKGNSLVVCVPVSDSVDCALKIQRKEADFGIFTAEEALLSSKFINDDVRVIGKLKNRFYGNETFSFETVVVVRENFNGGFGGFSGLRNTNYCHPGFGDGETWSDRVLKDFEKVVIPRSCHDNYANAQQEIYSIANFFNSSCRPGEWVLDDYLDKKLKKKFPSMCNLCDVRSRCSYNDEFQGSHIAALKCLTENGGDVAYVALEYLREYFGLIPGYVERAKPAEYKLLCPDGLTRPLNQPCTWIKQPWPVVVTAKDKARALSEAIPSFICRGSNCRGKWQEAFTKLFEKSSNVYYPDLEGEKTFLDILREGRTIPREFEGDACRRTVKWCTISEEEYEKCSWLRQAVISQDFEPRLGCVASSSMWSCFDLIKKKEADIIAIDSDYTFTAEKVFNLTTVMYQDNVIDGNYLITAIVRSDRKDIQSLADLKGKRACFPEYNGLAWNSFILAAQKKSLLPQVCPKILAVSQFFKDLCVPGAIDKDHKDYNVTGINNVCSLCVKKASNSKDNCEATFNNKFYGHFGAFSCLVGSNSTVAADVAFVDYRHLMSKQNEDMWKNIKKLDYRIMCVNGTLVPFPEGRDVDLDEKCAFSNGIRAQIVSRKQNTKAQMRDISDLLLKMEDKFGEVVSDFDNMIRMFGTFRGKKGVLLQETTVDFITVFDENNHQVNYFKELKNSAFEECYEPPSKRSAANVNKLGLTTSLLIFGTILINFLST